MKRHPNRALSTGQHGFTMIEVLIALLIIAVALAASIRAIGSIADNEIALHQRLLAGWSADSALASLRLSSAWPDTGTTRAACPQGDLILTCVETVSNTPNPLFRRVEIAVMRDQDHVRLAQLVTVVSNETARPL